VPPLGDRCGFTVVSLCCCCLQIVEKPTLNLQVGPYLGCAHLTSLLLLYFHSWALTALAEGRPSWVPGEQLQGHLCHLPPLCHLCYRGHSAFCSILDGMGLWGWHWASHSHGRSCPGLFILQPLSLLCWTHAGGLRFGSGCHVSCQK
jgi:hypothetical protein